MRYVPNANDKSLTKRDSIVKLLRYSDTLSFAALLLVFSVTAYNIHVL
jgi:hypothetical protein